MLDFYLEILSGRERVILLGHLVIRNRYAEIILDLAIGEYINDAIHFFVGKDRALILAILHLLAKAGGIHQKGFLFCVSIVKEKNRDIRPGIRKNIRWHTDNAFDDMLVYHPLPDGILNLALCGQKSRGDNDGSLTVIFHAVHDVLNEQQINRHRFLLAGRNFRNTRKETVRLRPLLLDSITGGGKVQFEGRISCLVGILLQARGRLMLHLKMGRVQQRVALNDMPQRLCHAVEHHVQAQEPSGFGRYVLRINNGTVQAVLLTEFMGQMQHQGAGAGSGSEISDASTLSLIPTRQRAMMELTDCGVKYSAYTPLATL